LQGSIITKENEEGKNVYFIKDGECTVEKLLCFEEGKEKRAENVEISIAESGATVGEECLLPEGRYLYTVKAKTNKVTCLVMGMQNAVAEIEMLHIPEHLTKKYRQKQ